MDDVTIVGLFGRYFLGMVIFSVLTWAKTSDLSIKTIKRESLLKRANDSKIAHDDGPSAISALNNVREFGIQVVSAFK